MNKRERLDKGWSCAREGYTDALHGKDNRDNYEGVYKVAYLYGHNKFYDEYYEDLDIKKEMTNEV